MKDRAGVAEYSQQRTGISTRQFQVLWGDTVGYFAGVLKAIDLESARPVF